MSELTQRELTEEVKAELREEVYEFLKEECEVDDISDDSLLYDDLDGDSLLLVELVESLKKKYELDIQLQTVGKFLLKKPADTVGQVIDTIYLIYQHGNNIVEFED